MLTRYSSILMARAWNLGEGKNHNLDDREYTTMVVAGFQVKTNYLKKKVQQQLQSETIRNAMGELRCGDWSGRSKMDDHSKQCYEDCCPSQLSCYIIDDFGYIFLTSTNSSYLGQHIGVIDPLLFQSMTNEGIFTEFKMTDYQGICDEGQENGPIIDDQEDDLINEYNTARPCTKEYSIYQFANPLMKTVDYTASCSTEVIQYQDLSLRKIIFFSIVEKWECNHHSMYRA